MKTLILIFFFSQYFCSLYIPNPLKKADAVKYHISDESKLLSVSGKEKAEKLIVEIKGLSSNCKDGGTEIGVALLNKMGVPPNTNKETFARELAKSVHTQWGIGKARCENGILILLAIGDRTMYFSTGAGIKDIVTDSKINNIIEKMKFPLRSGDIDGAVILALQKIRDILEGKFEETTFIDHIMSILVIVIPFGLLFWYIASKSKQESALRKKINNKLSLLERQKKSEKFDEKNCPICLETFTETENKKEILDCGHSFCDQCVTKVNNCPLCRMKIDRGEGEGNQKQNTYTQSHFNWQLGYLHSSYPHVITTTQYSTWTNPYNTAPLLIPEPTTSSSTSSSSSWGGGSSGGGGGSGGSW